MSDEAPRSRAARVAAETALVRVVHHYGPQAYAEQMTVDHPDLDRTVLIADAVVAVTTFHRLLTER